MSSKIPIDAPLWERMRALDRACDFVLERIDTHAAGSRLMTTRRNYSRMWRVRIMLRGEPKSALSSEAMRLADALRGAVEMAEGKGWKGNAP